MTVAIGINLGQYILIASDTREYALPPKTGYRDDVQKLRKTNIGLITGTGATQLLDAVKNRCASDELTGIDSFLRIVAEERQRASSFLDLEKQINRDLISFTRWIFSYTAVSSEQVANWRLGNGDAPQMRLGVYEPEIGHHVGLLPINDGIVIPPFCSDTDEQKGLTDMLVSQIHPCDKETGMTANIQRHAIIAGAFIRALAEKYPESVSSSYHIGIHTLHGQLKIEKVD